MLITYILSISTINSTRKKLLYISNEDTSNLTNIKQLNRSSNTIKKNRNIISNRNIPPHPTAKLTKAKPTNSRDHARRICADVNSHRIYKIYKKGEEQTAYQKKLGEATLRRRTEDNRLFEDRYPPFVVFCVVRLPSDANIAKLSSSSKFVCFFYIYMAG